MPTSRINIEVCINATDRKAVSEAVAVACAGGAATVELCRDMHLEGLTPKPDLIEAARTTLGPRRGLMAMIRPRGGDFSYTPAERKTMQQQILDAGRAGADGVVLGVLRCEDSRVFSEAMQPLVETAAGIGLSTTFHRAFDAAPAALLALDEVVQLGCQRLLTCGLPWGHPGSALDGAERLRQLVERAGQRLEVIIAGGVNPRNAAAILQRLATCTSGVGLHAYSGVQEQGQTTAASVATLVDAVRTWEASQPASSSRITARCRFARYPERLWSPVLRAVSVEDLISLPRARFGNSWPALLI